MVVYLPVAVVRDLIFSLLNPDLPNNHPDNGGSVLSSSIGLDFPLRFNEAHNSLDEGMGSCLISDKDLSEREEGQPLIPKIESKNEVSSWEIAKCSLFLTPLWFTTEVQKVLELF